MTHLASLIVPEADEPLSPFIPCVPPTTAEISKSIIETVYQIPSSTHVFYLQYSGAGRGRGDGAWSLPQRGRRYTRIV